MYIVRMLQKISGRLKIPLLRANSSRKKPHLLRGVSFLTKNTAQGEGSEVQRLHSHYSRQPRSKIVYYQTDQKSGFRVVRVFLQ